MSAKPSDRLLSPPRGSVEAALAYARERGAKRYDQVEPYVRELWRLCGAANLDFSLLFGQACDETGTFTSSYWVNFLNPAGLGALETLDRPGDIHYVGGSYTAKTAAQAHAVHAWAYAKGRVPNGSPLEPYVSFDPRYEAVFDAGYAGKATSLGYLSGTWAANLNYANQIVGHANRAFPNLPDQESGTTPTPQPADRKITYRIILDPAEQKEPRVSQAFGPTDFARSTCQPGSEFWHLYWYARDGGTDGCEHPAADWGMPRGTPLYCPVEGVVEVAGGRPYYKFYGDGSLGVGQLSILRPNGDRITLGHMMRITVVAGQTLKPGDPVGLSGGENGDHVHVEVEELLANGKRRYVDPATYDYGTRATQPTPQPTPGKVVFGRVPKPPINVRIIDNSEAWNNLGQRIPKAIIIHTMLGTLWGTDGYFRGEARTRALTDFGVGPTGEVIQWNDHKGIRSPWASGPWRGGEGDGPAFVAKYGVNGINRFGVSMETEGMAWTSEVSSAMYESVVAWAAWIMDEANVAYSTWPLNNDGLQAVYFHWEFCTRAYKLCAGSRWDQRIDQFVKDVGARLKKYQLTAGPQPQPEPTPKPEPTPRPTPTVPAWINPALALGLTVDDLRGRFGESIEGYGFDMAGQVTRAWVEDGVQSGEWPALEDVEDRDTDDRWFAFDGGRLYHWDGKALRRLKGVAAVQAKADVKAQIAVAPPPTELPPPPKKPTRWEIS